MHQPQSSGRANLNPNPPISRRTLASFASRDLQMLLIGTLHLRRGHCMDTACAGCSARRRRGTPARDTARVLHSQLLPIVRPQLSFSVALLGGWVRTVWFAVVQCHGGGMCSGARPLLVHDVHSLQDLLAHANVALDADWPVDAARWSARTIGRRFSSAPHGEATEKYLCAAGNRSRAHCGRSLNSNSG